MDYTIVKKEAFTVIANVKTFPYEGAKESVPQFWQEHYQAGMGQYICGQYGINIDLEMSQENFEYLIADPYNPQKDIPGGWLQERYLHLTGQYFLVKGQCQMLFRMLIRRFIQSGYQHLRSMNLLPDTA